MTFDKQRLSFGAAAQHYDRSRPGYPAAALTWALGEPPARVVDLGAGTGLLTRTALAAGFEVIPVEPDLGMRDQLAAATPGTTPLAGSAESIPLPDGTADAIIAGQAYHWFDRATAHPEIARVLRPGGVFAPVWNYRDTSMAWAGALDEIIGTEQNTSTRLEDEPDFGPLLSTPHRREFRHSTTQSPQGLCDLVASRSYYLTSTPDRQQELLAQVLQLCASHPALAGRESFELTYVTVVYRSIRR